MTEAEMVPVTQADADAAIVCWNALSDAGNDWFSLSVDEQLALMEAFSHHRLAAEAAAIEKCLEIAEQIPTDWRDGTQPGPLSAYAHATREIATAIRSLKEGASHVG